MKPLKRGNNPTLNKHNDTKHSNRTNRKMPPQFRIRSPSCTTIYTGIPTADNSSLEGLNNSSDTTDCGSEDSVQGDQVVENTVEINDCINKLLKLDDFSGDREDGRPQPGTSGRECETGELSTDTVHQCMQQKKEMADAAAAAEAERKADKMVKEAERSKAKIYKPPDECKTSESKTTEAEYSDDDLSDDEFCLINAKD